MAKRNESTSEKIVRLYKEGYSPEDISKLMEIPKGNIPNILEKHFPDYQNYVQPEKPRELDVDKPKKSGGIGGLFGRGKKEEPVDAAASSLNLDMDDEGFIDRSVAGIASMIKKGRSPKDICAFLNCTPADVAAVSAVMDEHFRRKEAAEQAKKDSFRTGPNYDGPKVKESTDLLSGTPEVDNEPVRKFGAVPAPIMGGSHEPEPVPEQQEYVPPVYDPVPENPTMDELIVPNVDELTFGSDIPKTPSTAAENESENYEIPSAAPIAADNTEEEKTEESKEPEAEENKDDKPEEQKEEKPEEKDEKPEETKTERPVFKPISSFTPKASTAAVNDEEDTTDYTIEEDESMTPMEKMKKFAELQIKDNDEKIAYLEKKAVTAKASAASVATKVGEIEAQIAKLKAEADKIVADKVKAEAEAADIDAQIAALKKENEEFKSYIK